MVRSHAASISSRCRRKQLNLGDPPADSFDDPIPLRATRHPRPLHVVAGGGQGAFSDILVRRARARRLLCREGGGALRQGRARRDDPHGRPADQHGAAASRGRSRLHHRLRFRDLERARTRPAGRHRRHLFPKRYRRHPRPRRRGEPGGAQRPADRHRRRVAPHLLAVAAPEIRLHRRADPSLHVQHAALFRRPHPIAAGLPHLRAVHRRPARAQDEILPALPTSATRPIRRRSSRRTPMSPRTPMSSRASSRRRSRAGAITCATQTRPTS